MGKLMYQGIQYTGGGSEGENIIYMTKAEYDQITPEEDQLYGIIDWDSEAVALIKDGVIVNNATWSSQKMVNTFAQKTQISNPNLLDNGWFTVNQRGVTEIEHGKYSFDRWLSGRIVGTVVNGKPSIKFNGATGTTMGFYYQKIGVELSNDLVNKTITLSAIIDDTLCVLTGVAPQQNGTTLNSGYIFGNGDISLVYEWTSASTWGVNVCIRSKNAEVSHTIKAIKLELGSISTLALDTAPNYATELLKCQRYFVRVTGGTNNNGILSVGGFVLTASQVRCQIPLPIQMRTNPAITTGGNIRIGTPSSTIVTSDKITSWALASLSPNHINISANVNATLTVDTPVNYYCQSDTTAHIDISADL